MVKCEYIFKCDMCGEEQRQKGFAMLQHMHNYTLPDKWTQLNHSIYCDKHELILNIETEGEPIYKYAMNWFNTIKK